MFIITQIRVDDAVKAELIARLGPKATHYASDRVGFSCFVSFCKYNKLRQMVSYPSTDVTLRLEEVSEQAHASSTGTTDSHSMVCSRSARCT